MSGGGQQASGGATEEVARGIREMVQPDLAEGRLLRAAVLITQTEEPDGTGARTDVYYPLGSPDRATERAMLGRAIDRLRNPQ